jgi:hypothetical protein
MPNRDWYGSTDRLITTFPVRSKNVNRSLTHGNRFRKGIVANTFSVKQTSNRMTRLIPPENRESVSFNSGTGCGASQRKLYVISVWRTSLNPSAASGAPIWAKATSWISVASAENGSHWVAHQPRRCLGVKLFRPAILNWHQWLGRAQREECLRRADAYSTELLLEQEFDAIYARSVLY